MCLLLTVGHLAMQTKAVNHIEINMKRNINMHKEK